jgi:putative salt-induced outer membrane protein YdiY
MYVGEGRELLNMSWEYTDTACMLSGMHAYAKHATDIEIQNKICRKLEIKKLFNLKIKSVYKSRDHRIAFLFKPRYV